MKNYIQIKLNKKLKNLIKTVKKMQIKFLFKQK